MYHIVVCMAVMTLLSCSREEHTPDDPVAAISFESPSVLTKSLVESVSDLEGGFGVYASRYTAAYTASDFISNLNVAKDGSYTGAYYWAPGASHLFFAVYPWADPESDVVDNGVSYEMDPATRKRIDVNYTDLTDILYDAVLFEDPFVPGSRPGKIKFDLKHACSAISFCVNNLSGKNIKSITKTGSLDDVSIDGLNTKGDLSIVLQDGEAAAVWENVSTGNSLVLPAINIVGDDTWPDGEQRDWHTHIIIPQNYAALEVSMSFRIDYENNDYYTFTVNLSDIKTEAGGYEYHAGKHYKYKIDITNQDIMCYVNIVPWVEDDTIILE